MGWLAAFDKIFEGPLARLLRYPLTGQVPRKDAAGLERKLHALAKKARFHGSVAELLLELRTPRLDDGALTPEIFDAMKDEERRAVFYDPDQWDCQLRNDVAKSPARLSARTTWTRSTPH